MEHIQEIRILYSDTDAYGVVWHGAYTKWFEAARVEFIESLGIDVKKLEETIVFPVVEMNIRYKSSAKLNDRIIIKTSLKELKPMGMTFEHNVYDKETNILRTVGLTSIVSVDPKTGKLIRRLPQDLYSKLEKLNN